MKKNLLFVAVIFSLLSLTSCSRMIHSGNGGYTDLSLNRNSDEYTLKRLNKVELDGTAFCGIPGFGSNNKNKNKSGLMFRFNGVELGSTARLFPILTMVGLSVISGKLVQAIAGQKTVNNGSYYDGYNNYYGYNPYNTVENRLSTGVSIILGLPLAGIANNLLWTGAAASGLTNQVYYQIVDENPGVDVFLTPKYKIDYKHGLFTQKANVKAEVTGATLKIK